MASHICRAAPAFHSSCGLWQIVVLFKAMGFGGNHASREPIESGTMCEASVVLLDVASLKIDRKKYIEAKKDCQTCDVHLGHTVCN